jgi:uncharacterized membrane protein YkvA (DUF1232 family)
VAEDTLGSEKNSRKAAWKLLAQFREELSVYQRVARDPRTPRLAKWLLGAAVAYALSPIDLIPDFIPVIGYLDDLLIVPLLVWLGMRLIPRQVMSDARKAARP